MGDILYFLLNATTYKRKILLCTNTTTLASMVFKDENVLILESKTQDVCRIILNQRDLMRLLNLEKSIYKSIMRPSESNNVSITFCIIIIIIHKY